MKILKIILVLLMAGCQSSSLTSAGTGSNFKKLQDRFFTEYWVLNPDYAMYQGHPDYPAALVVPDEKNKKRQLEFYQKYQKTFNEIVPASLPVDQSTDLEILKNIVDGAVWWLTVYKTYEWDPSKNNVGNVIGTIWENQKRTVDEKLKLLMPILTKTPAYYQAGFKNIKNPTLEHLNLAIKQNQGTLSYLDKSLKPAIEKNGLSLTENKELNHQFSLTKKVISDYIWKLDALKKSKKTFRSFRLKPEIYRQKFEYDLQTSHSAEEIYQKAVQARSETHQKMEKLAHELWPKYFANVQPPKEPLVLIKKVLEKISLQHPTADEFLPSIQKQIPELWDFVVKHDLLSLEKDKILKVRETPEYQRGVAGASIDSPGPFEPMRETYYNVTPPTDLPLAAQESYLREYNNYMLQILNIHEAIPGHYAQLVYSNKVKSPVKQIFGNGTMTEGWAVYAERMMLEQGYGDNRPELWLMYYKWFLRVACNTILDYSVHNLGMTKDQGMNLLMNQAFQEKSEAQEKWNRATLTQVQLASYFAGFSEIYTFRESEQQRYGDKFSLRKFHDQFLSYGSIPIKTIVKLMKR